MDTPEIKNDKITNKQVTTYKVICFCCEKDFEEKDITKIIVGKDKITGSIERRFVCKRCNHLPEYQKDLTLEMEIDQVDKKISSGEAK